MEDDPDEAELALTALRRNDLTPRVVVAKDGAEALDFLFGTGPFADRGPGGDGLRLILLDMKLPKVDGLEVLKRIKSDERTRRIPVVVLTSSQEDRDVAESYRLGVNSYLVKPVAFERFVDVVAKLGQYWLLFNHRPE